MLLGSFIATRPGVQGLVNRIIRWRLRGQVSHTEVVFEPDDGVDDLMPDGTCQPDANGALWFASAVAWERLPAWSRRRAGKRGGVRFKRVVPAPGHWIFQKYRRDARKAAETFRQLEGMPYAWRLIMGWMAWALGKLQQSHRVCSQVAAEAGGYAEPWRFDPCVLRAAVEAEVTVPPPLK